MNESFNDRDLYAFFKQRILDKLEVAGKIVEETARQNLENRNRTGNLRDSIIHEVNESDLSAKIGSNVVYAAIQEYGGTIVPKNAKALAVPIHPDAKARAIPVGKTVRDIFPDLIMIKRNGKPPLLIRNAGRGMNHGRMDIMYVLVQSVTLKGNPYLRPALYNNIENINNVFAL